MIAIVVETYHLRKTMVARTVAELIIVIYIHVVSWARSTTVNLLVLHLYRAI